MTKNEKLLADQVRKLYENTVFGSVATLVNGSALVFVLRDQANAMSLRIWLGAAILISIVRLWLFWGYRKSASRDAETAKWRFSFLASIFFVGILWGSAAIFLFPVNSVEHQVFIAFATGGMVAGAVGAFTAVLTAFFLFGIPALMPIIVRCFMAGDEIHFAMGAMTLFFLVIMSLMALHTHGDFISLFSLRYENSELVEDLKREVEQRKKAEDDLRERNKQIEDIVETRTAELKDAVRKLRDEVEARKKVARALEENRQRMRAIVNAAPLIIWAVDDECVFTFSEGKMLVKIGLEPGELVGKSLFTFFGDNDRIIRDTQKALAGEVVSGDTTFRGIIYENRCQPIMDEEEKIVGAIGVAIDVTERKKAQEALFHLNETLEKQVADRTRLAEARANQLQALAVELIEAEERERRRIAMLLHDDLQQMLAATKFQIQAAQGSESPESILREAVVLLEESIEKSRSLSHELSPPVLSHSDLPGALSWLAKRMGEKFGLQIETNSKAKTPFENEPLKLFMFRAVQELLFNVAKHAGVKTARIDYDCSKRGLFIAVSDNGRGFDPESLDSFGDNVGLGLLSMRERARHMGVKLEIESRYGMGSRFVLSVPARGSEAAGADIAFPEVDQAPRESA